MGASAVNYREPILELRKITKHFGGVHALDGVDLVLYPDEVLAIVGDNGAGKSTLIKTVSGAHRPDSGEILFQGKKVDIRTPHVARQLGIETVYQDLALVNTLDVVENVFLGRSLTKLRYFVDKKEMAVRTRDIIRRLNINIPFIREPVQNMSGGQRQSLALGRAVAWGGKIVVLDEPTAALGVKEKSKVLTLIKQLKENGVAVIVISHNMRDVFDVSDRIVVLRGGRCVASRPRTETNMEEIIKLITGALDSVDLQKQD
jgi:D-xylose transport system ATP-binding protein